MNIPSKIELCGNSGGHAPPVSNPSLSYWQRTTRGFPLLHANYNTPIPKTAKYVVIGSGLAGALTIFELIERGVKGSDIVLLEAREAVSGATARNAGHVRPDPFRGFTAHARVHGPEQAVKIIANERLVFERVVEFVKHHAVPCDLHVTTTFDVCLTPEFTNYEAAAFEGFKAAGGDVSHVHFFSGKEAQKRTRVRDAITAYEWPAASIHPAKLTQWILNEVVSRGVKFFTHCPALKIRQNTVLSSAASGRKFWDIATPRGEITSPTVIHCTNAYAAFLLPQLARFLTPKCAQAQSVVPSHSLAGNNTLKHTYRLWHGLFHVYSVIQRQDDGTLVLGGSLKHPALSQASLDSIVSIDDRTFNKEVVTDRLKQLKSCFGQDASAPNVHGEGLEHAWTGIIGMTEDTVPFIGAMPGLEGQFICAGFNGFGMASIFTCAPGVASLALGSAWEDTGLPECYEISQERINRMMNRARL